MAHDVNEGRTSLQFSEENYERLDRLERPPAHSVAAQSHSGGEIWGIVMRIFLRFVLMASLVFAPGPSWANGNVFLEATFESGKIQRVSSSTIDALFIQTLPDPQIADEGISTGAGGFGPESKWDTKVVRGEQVGSDVVLPRSGEHFLRSALYLEKDYNILNGYSADKPRSTINLAGTNAGLAFEHDEEAWIGFSIFLPSNWEHELGRTDDRGAVMLLSLSDMRRHASAAALSIWTPSGSTKAHWQVRILVNDSAVSGEEQVKEWISLGSVEPDLGKWTDFVIRVRSNPFKTDTNPAKLGISGAIDKLYGGNQGIFQVWKSEGESREMVQKVNRVNTPVGYVPGVDRPIEVSFRVYKYGWKRHPTTVKGPVWVGFDELRYGTTDRHGTEYSSVVPGGNTPVSSVPRAPAVGVE